MFKNIFLIVILGITAFTNSCMLPLASKILLEYDPDVRAERIQYEKTGSPLIMSLIPINQTMDLKLELEIMKTLYSCNEMKNIDIQYRNLSYYVIGFEKLVVYADCIRKSRTPSEDKGDTDPQVK